MRVRTLTVAVAMLLSLCLAPRAGAESTLAHLRVGVDRVFEALGDPALDGKADERRQVIHRLVEDLFDWTEMGQRLLGSIWNDRTAGERARFTGFLANMIDAHLLALAASGVDHIVWDEQTIAGGEATVRTTVVTKHGRRLPLDYRMTLRDDRWRIYDVAIDKASLLGNYRAQFRQIIKKSSYEALVDKLSQ
jgi:phospholipid transport system substrate-binding protein